MSKNRDFKGIWIPAKIWLDKDLGWVEKVLLVEIDSLSSNGKPCWATNRYFAEFFGLSERTISRYINGLKSKKMIKITDKTSTGGQRLLAPLDKTVYPSSQKRQDPLDKTVYHNNTVNNTKNNTTTICSNEQNIAIEKIVFPEKDPQPEGSFSHTVECLERRTAELGFSFDATEVFGWLEENNWELSGGWLVDSFFVLDKALRNWQETATKREKAFFP